MDHTDRPIRITSLASSALATILIASAVFSLAVLAPTLVDASHLVPLSLLMMTVASFLLSAYFAPARTLLRIGSFMLLISAGLSGFGNWLPQVEGGFPPPGEFKADVYSMTAQQLADEGERIIFGGIGQSKVSGAIGRGQCPLCHSFQPEHLVQAEFLLDRAPNLWGITARKRLHATSIEYIAESHLCPSCYVVGGFGVRGTENRESPMPAIHKPPISLTLNEFIAVDTWLFVHEGETPPTPDEIRAAYLKVVPESDFRKPAQESKPVPQSVLYPAGMSTEALFRAARCVHCHVIPGIRHAVGGLGPTLSFNSEEAFRFKAADYRGSATTLTEYVEESILDHNRDIVPGYRVGLLPDGYYLKAPAGAVHRMVEYLVKLGNRT